MGLDLVFGMMYGTHYHEVIEDLPDKIISTPTFDKYTGEPAEPEKSRQYQIKLLVDILTFKKGDIIQPHKLSKQLQSIANKTYEEPPHFLFYNYRFFGFWASKAEKPYLPPQDYAFDYEHDPLAEEAWSTTFPHIKGKYLLFMHASI